MILKLVTVFAAIVVIVALWTDMLWLNVTATVFVGALLLSFVLEYLADVVCTGD